MAADSKAPQPPPRLAAAATSGAAATPAPSSQSRLAAALRDEAGIADGRLPGVYKSTDDIRTAPLRRWEIQGDLQAHWAFRYS